MALVDNPNMYYDQFYNKVEALSPESLNSITPPPSHYYQQSPPMDLNQTMHEQFTNIHSQSENYSPNAKQTLPSFSKSYSQRHCRSLDTHVLDQSSFPTPSPESFRSTSPDVEYFGKNYVNLEVTADLFRLKDSQDRMKLEDPETLYRMNTFNTVFDYAKNNPVSNTKDFAKFDNEFKMEEENFDEESVLSSEDFFDEDTRDEFSNTSNITGKQLDNYADRYNNLTIYCIGISITSAISYYLSTHNIIFSLI